MTTYSFDMEWRPMGDWDERSDGKVMWYFPENPWPSCFYYGSPYDDAFPLGVAQWCPCEVTKEDDNHPEPDIDDGWEPACDSEEIPW